MVNFHSTDVQRMNRTARKSGAVGSKPVVLDAVRKIADKYSAILDYGAGSTARQAEMLRGEGYARVSTWEIGENFVDGVHDPDALGRQYDIVYASNVLNVQPTFDWLEHTMSELAGLVSKDGYLIVNYPQSPRYLPDVSMIDIVARLSAFFSEIERVRGTSVIVARF